MSGNDFFETLNKYRILDNQSNMVSQIFLDKVSSNFKIELETKNYISYGYIFISVTNPNNLNIFYKDLWIANINTSDNIIIPCAFEENSYLQIQGTSDDFSLSIYGAKISNQVKYTLIPTQNCIVKNRGKCSILSYDSIEDIKNNNLIETLSIDNCLDVQSVKFAYIEYLAYLESKNDILYLYTKKDNYTTGLEITTSVKNAKILYDSKTEQIIIVYIRNNCGYYRTISQDLVLSVEKSISFSNNYIPKSFSQIQLMNFSGPTLLGINYHGETTEIFVFNGAKFVPILNKSSNLSKILIDSNNIEIYSISDYKINISKYLYDYSINSLNQVGISYNIWNANDIIKVGDKYLVYNNSVCSEVSYDSET